MTKQKALLSVLKIINECDKHSEENGSCKECPFAIDGVTCMASGGNDIPHTWHIKDKISNLI